MLTIEASAHGVFDKAVQHGGNVADPHDAAVSVGLDDNLFEIAASVCLSLGAYKYVTALRANVAARQVHGAAAYGLRNVGQGDVKLAQSIR